MHIGVLAGKHILFSVWRDNPNEEIEERDIQEDFRSAQEGIQVRFDLCDLKRINQ